MSVESAGSLSRSNSKITLPEVRVEKRAIAYLIILLVCVVATVDTVRTFLINERALLTTRGRERHRTRRRTYRKTRRCDESDEPKPWQFDLGWLSLRPCVEYDLSLRRRPLGDKGVRRLVRLLGRREYATRNHRGQLRVLNLQRQGITRRGAGYLARWLSVDPLEVSGATADLVDVDRMPTAASRSIFINLEGNPIGLLGVKDLERAVEKARINGIRVVIVGGGSLTDSSPAGGRAGRQHTVKLGPIEYSTRKSVEMPPWRLPVPRFQKLVEMSGIGGGGGGGHHPILPSLRGAIIFCVGLLIGRASVVIPYTIAIVPVVRSTG